MNPAQLTLIALVLFVLWGVTFLRLCVVIHQRSDAERRARSAWQALSTFEDQVAEAMKLGHTRHQGPRREAIVRQLREDFAND